MQIQPTKKYKINQIVSTHQNVTHHLLFSNHCCVIVWQVIFDRLMNVGRKHRFGKLP
jgi:hypothetical protein